MSKRGESHGLIPRHPRLQFLLPDQRMDPISALLQLCSQLRMWHSWEGPVKLASYSHEHTDGRRVRHTYIHVQVIEAPKTISGLTQTEAELIQEI